MATKQTQEIELGLTRNEYNDPTRTFRAVLEIETDKWTGEIRATAKVMWHGHHSRQHAYGLGGGGDFSKTLAKSPARATQKAIDTLHAQTFTPEVIAALTAEALDWYATGKDKR